MDPLTAFKIAQLAIICVFVVFISDVRKRPEANALINQKMQLALKLIYLFPLSVYVYSLIMLNYLTAFDLTAMLVTFTGTSVVVMAKTGLADKHTWTGYCLNSNCFTTSGIYAYIRHPLYTGIYIFILGAATTMFFHNFLLLNILLLASLVYIMSFLAVAAKRETGFLSEKLGDSFKQYQRQVHPFFPLRKYKPIT